MKIKWQYKPCHVVELEEWDQEIWVVPTGGAKWGVMQITSDGAEWWDEEFNSDVDARRFVEQKIQEWAAMEENAD
jgi:hypothetical protein